MLVVGSAVTGGVTAQTSSGTLSGRVTYENNGLAGVTVSVTSPVLQGQRAAVTTSSGDYTLHGLPGGIYRTTFRLQGFRTLEQDVKISAAQSRFVDAVMVPETVSGSIQVTARHETVSTSLTGAETVEQEMLEKLAANRSLLSAVSLAAGTANTGPARQTVISGSQSFENLYTMNGIVLNETIRQQPLSIFIEDSIQDTTVLTSKVSAEFGRFSGGVVNMITKSGGNRLTGSFRVGLDNDDWSARTPLSSERLDVLNDR